MNETKTQQDWTHALARETAIAIYGKPINALEGRGETIDFKCSWDRIHDTTASIQIAIREAVEREREELRGMVDDFDPWPDDVLKQRDSEVVREVFRVLEMISAAIRNRTHDKPKGGDA